MQPVEKVIAGKYEILEKIREGGMGAIYKVRHRLLDEVRIIKVLRSDLAMDEKLRLRFQNEAKFAIQLRHPNIAHLYDFSVSADGTSAYIVMEYIDGVTLQELITESGAPTLGLAVEIAGQSLQAIGYLHQQGFVHRDIAADNLMLTRDFEGNPLVKLIDLGIAKGQDQEVNLTVAGTFMGKVRYSAPELFKEEGGAAALDERSDLYSFGILLYELLTGQAPVRGDTFSEIVAGHLFRPPLPFEESDPDGLVPEELRAIVLNALEKDPAQRIASAVELLDRLTPFASREDSHTEEFARAIEATAQLATLRPKSSAGVSTQSRLDRQFKADDPSSHRAEREQRRDEAVAHAASAIRERTRIGELARAGEDLELAQALYGEHPELEAVKQELRAPEIAATGEAPAREETAAPGATPPRRPDRAYRRGLLGWLGSPVGALAAAGAMLLVVGTLLVVKLGVPANGIPAPTGQRLLVERAPVWSEDAGGAVFQGAPALTDDPSLEEPPPPADEAAEPVAPTASEPDRPALEQPVPAPQPRPSPPEPRTPPRPEPAPDIHRGVLFGIDPGVTPPTLVQVPPPVYPSDFRAPNSKLELMVEVLVSEDGHVITARLAPRQSAKKRFEELAVETAKQATFRPATKQGVEGKMWTTIRVTLPPG